MRHLLLIFMLCCFADAVGAQTADSTLVLKGSPVTDSTKREFWGKRFFTKGYPNPRKAALMSLVIPGSGQAYNKSWWKIPLVYAAIGTAGYFAVTNGKQYKALKDNYKWSVDRDSTTFPTVLPYSAMSVDNLRENRDVWRRYTEWSYMALGFIWLLGSADAFVDGHLKHFDVSDDLSFDISPDTKSVPGFGPTFGMTVKVKL